MECVRCHDPKKYGKPVMIQYAPHLRGGWFSPRERWEKRYLCKECAPLAREPLEHLHPE